MLTPLRRIIQDVSAAPTFREALELLVHDVRESLGTEVCSVYLRNIDTDGFLFASTEGLNTAAVGLSLIHI